MQSKNAVGGALYGAAPVHWEGLKTNREPAGGLTFAPTLARGADRFRPHVEGWSGHSEGPRDGANLLPRLLSGYPVPSAGAPGAPLPLFLLHFLSCSPRSPEASSLPCLSHATPDSDRSKATSPVRSLPGPARASERGIYVTWHLLRGRALGDTRPAAALPAACPVSALTGCGRHP